MSSSSSEYSTLGTSLLEGWTGVAALVGCIIFAPFIWPLIAMAYLYVWLVYWKLAQDPSREGLTLPWGWGQLPYLPWSPVRVCNVAGVSLAALYRILFSPAPWIAGRWIVRKVWSKRDKHVVRGIPYGRDGNRYSLDVYKPHPSSTIHSMTIPRITHASPVLIFFQGGSWVSGSKELYEPLALTLASREWLVIVPDLAKFPMGKMDIMLQNARDVYDWTLDNIHRFGGDADAIFFMGHSSGAHLASLSTLHFQLPIRGVILISGMYDVSKQVAFETQRGVEEISALSRVMGKPSFWKSMSPIHQVNRSIVRNWCVMHGDLDHTFPLSQGHAFYEKLLEEGMDNVSFTLLKGAESSHSALILDLMDIEKSRNGWFMHALDNFIGGSGSRRPSVVSSSSSSISNYASSNKTASSGLLNNAKKTFLDDVHGNVVVDSFSRPMGAYHHQSGGSDEDESPEATLPPIPPPTTASSSSSEKLRKTGSFKNLRGGFLY